MVLARPTRATITRITRVYQFQQIDIVPDNLAVGRAIIDVTYDVAGTSRQSRSVVFASTADLAQTRTNMIGALQRDTTLRSLFTIDADDGARLTELSRLNAEVEVRDVTGGVTYAVNIDRASDTNPVTWEVELSQEFEVENTDIVYIQSTELGLDHPGHFVVEGRRGRVIIVAGADGNEPAPVIGGPGRDNAYLIPIGQFDDLNPRFLPEWARIFRSASSVDVVTGVAPGTFSDPSSVSVTAGGRISAIVAGSTAAVRQEDVGANSGVAPLDASGMLPAARLPISSVTIIGTWNASTNTPTLASGTGTTGDTYFVSVAGTTTLDGESTWDIGDMLIFANSVWNRIPVSEQDLAGDTTGPRGATVNVALQGHAVEDQQPFDRQLLQWSTTGDQWEPTFLGLQYVSLSSSITLSAPNDRSLFEYIGSGGTTWTLPSSSTVETDWFLLVKNSSSNDGNLTIQRSGSDTINGQTSIVVAPGQLGWIIESGGTAFRFIPASEPLATILAADVSGFRSDDIQFVRVGGNDSNAGTTALEAVATMAQAITNLGAGVGAIVAFDAQSITTTSSDVTPGTDTDIFMPLSVLTDRLVTQAAAFYRFGAINVASGEALSVANGARVNITDITGNVSVATGAHTSTAIKARVNGNFVVNASATGVIWCDVVATGTITIPSGVTIVGPGVFESDGDRVRPVLVGSIQAGTGISVDSTDPESPIVSVVDAGNAFRVLVVTSSPTNVGTNENGAALKYLGGAITSPGVIQFLDADQYADGFSGRIIAGDAPVFVQAATGDTISFDNLNAQNAELAIGDTLHFVKASNNSWQGFVTSHRSPSFVRQDDITGSLTIVNATDAVTYGGHIIDCTGTSTATINFNAQTATLSQAFWMVVRNNKTGQNVTLASTATGGISGDTTLVPGDVVLVTEAPTNGYRAIRLSRNREEARITILGYDTPSVQRSLNDLIGALEIQIDIPDTTRISITSVAIEGITYSVGLGNLTVPSLSNGVNTLTATIGGTDPATWALNDNFVRPTLLYNLDGVGHIARGPYFHTAAEGFLATV